MNTKDQAGSNDNRDSENSPAFRAFVGSRALATRGSAIDAETPRDYLRVKLDVRVWPSHSMRSVLSEDGKEHSSSGIGGEVRDKEIRATR